MKYDRTSNFFMRPHNVLSAVTGMSKEGYMTFGPFIKIPPTDSDSKVSFCVEFFLRSPNVDPALALVNIDVYNGVSDDVVAARQVLGSDLEGENIWTRVVLSAAVASAENSIEARVWWYGNSNVDIACVRIRLQLAL